MKKSVFILLVAFLSTTTIFGQAEKDLKGATKALNKYFLDPGGNADLLPKAIELLNSAFQSEEVKKQASSWITRGEIYNEVANNEFKEKTLDPAYKIGVADAAIQAFQAFSQAQNIAEKKGEKKSILAGMTEAENHLNNFAIFAYTDQDYATAFKNFSSTLQAFDLIKSIGGESRLAATEDIYNEQLFYTAISGYYGGMMYSINKEEGAPDAVKYLEEGRKLFPDDTSILFAEINHYLTEGKLEQLIDKLKTAITKEPDNVTVYTTLGSVYDQLQAQSLEAGDEEKASMYFDNAFDYYNQALERDGANFEATYSMGALYYNKAASYVDKLNEFAADLTPAGMKKYDATKIEMDELFGKALPFFTKAEGMNAKDGNTLIALKEIYARLNDIEKSNEYKTKIEALGMGK